MADGDAVVEPQLRARGRSATPHRKRLDIQGMRALAVGVVLVYHVWPDLLPGGFIGVDVFFVLSGYLIIGSLARELERNGRIRLMEFYQRRIRRLLPAASVVLLVTVGLSLWVLAPSRLLRNLGDAVASSLQVANWRFAFGPDAYAEATAGVSPFQHFWSLAIEEQFYIVIPVLLMLIGTFAHVRRRSVRQMIVVALILVTALSFIWSVVQTFTSPSIAYFSTATRAWELLAGGLGALLIPRAIGHVASAVLGVSGLLLVVASAAMFSTELPFPGALALIPVVGTVLLLAAGVAAKPGPITWVLERRPLTWVGDISYSLYLWHWPIVVVALSLFGPSLGRLDGPVVIAVSLVVAALSERFVERPFRVAHSSSTRPQASRPYRVRREFIAGGAAIALTAAFAAVPLVVMTAQIAQARDANAVAYPGAGVFDGAQVPPGLPVLPDPRAANHDVSLANRDHCIEHDLTAPTPDQPSTMCRYGPKDPTHHVMLVDDSHAAVLSTPLADLAESEGFGLTALVRNGCPFTVVSPGSAAEAIDPCEEQNLRSRELILREAPDTLVVTAMSPVGYERALSWSWPSYEEAVSGYVEMLRPIADSATQVVVVRDTPNLPFSSPDCVAGAPLADVGACAIERLDLEQQPDPLVDAAATLEGVVVVDLTPHICRPESCESVEGNVLVYRDNHLTDTYARTLADALRPVMTWTSSEDI